MAGGARFRMQGWVVLVFVLVPAAARAGEDAREREIEDLRERVERLEGERAPAAGDPAALAPSGGDAGLLERLLSGREEYFSLKGELEFEYIDTESGEHAAGDVAEPEPRFNLDKLVLQPLVSFKEVPMDLLAEIEFKEDDTALKVARLQVKELPMNSWLKVGRDYPMYQSGCCDGSNRLTETYPLSGSAFWREPKNGIWWGGEREIEGAGEAEPVVSWALGYTDGLGLGDRQPGEDGSYRFLADRESGEPDKHEFMALGGLKFGEEKHDLGQTEIVAFATFDKLSDDEQAILAALPGYTGDADDEDQRRYGTRLTFKRRGFMLVAEYITAEDGELDRDAWYVQPSYKVKLTPSVWKGRDFLTSITPVYRYGALDVDLDADPLDPYTWDREQHTLGLLTEITKNVTLKTEYTWNVEDTGGSGDLDDPENNELVIQLEVKF